MDEMITSADAEYVLDVVRQICKQAGPGISGTPQECMRAEMVRNELEKHLGSANVWVEEFTLAPAAVLGSLPLSASFMIAAVLMNLSPGYITGISPWVTAVAALSFSIISIFIINSGYLTYSEKIDILFKKKRSQNVIGSLIKPGVEKVQRLLIISGHHDSAPENRWFRWLRYAFYITLPTILIGYAAVLLLSIIQLAGGIAGSDGLIQAGTLKLGLLIYPVLPAILFAMFFNMGRKNGGTVLGAADNLSACAVVAAMARFLVQHPSSIPDDTEIRFITFGSEEVGLRGSKRYVERHLDELKCLDARLLNFETIAHPHINILTSDLGGVKNSPEMIESVENAAQRAEVPFRVTPYPKGGQGSDAGPFSQAGIKALTLLSMKIPQQLVAFYHQKWDTPDVLTIEPLLNVLKLTLEWVCSGGEVAHGNKKH